MIQHVWGLSLPSGFPEGVLSINNHSTLKTGGSRSMLCLLVPSPRKYFSVSQDLHAMEHLVGFIVIITIIIIMIIIIITTIIINHHQPSLTA